MPQGTIQKKVMFISGLFLLAIFIVFVILLIQNRSTGNALDIFSGSDSEKKDNANTNSAVTSVPPDDDGDGLSNESETALGTDKAKADSDSDGLIDYDENLVYKSDPLNPDTDGDGNSDGTEVANGYSPIDDTKLLDLEREKSKLN